MHELSIAVDVVKSAENAIPLSLKGHRVTKITLDIGKMAGVTLHSLKFCFDIAAKGTALESAELVIHEIPVMAKCRSCLNGWVMSEPDFQCASCGSVDVSLETGRELVIRAMDVEEEGE